MKDFSSTINEIYSHFQDDYGRNMYANRLLYSLTGDNQYIKKVISMTAEGSMFLKKLMEYKKIFIFGAGTWGKEIVNTYQELAFAGFIDNNSKCSNICGIPVFSFDEFLKKRESDYVIVIGSRLYYKEIYEQLASNGIDDANILNAGKMIDNMSIRQYFDLPELRKYEKEEESFVDCGSFDGRTSLLFSEWHRTKKGNIYAFEPELRNLKLCKDLLDKLEKNSTNNRWGGYKCVVYPVGVWNRKDVLHFKSGSSGASCVSDEGDISINVDTLDSVLNGEEVSFIKMDLEGSEYKALCGSAELIRKYKPKLAISIYHKPEDIWELPELILSFNPEYKFYLGHYSIAAAETVLYAL